MSMDHEGENRDPSISQDVSVNGRKERVITGGDKLMRLFLGWGDSEGQEPVERRNFRYEKERLLDCIPHAGGGGEVKGRYQGHCLGRRERGKERSCGRLPEAKDRP